MMTSLFVALALALTSQVQAGYCVVPAGTTFVPGACLSPTPLQKVRCVPSGSATPQVAGVAFQASVVAVDSSCNVINLTGSKTLTWTGLTAQLANPNGDGTALTLPNGSTAFTAGYSPALTFVAGRASNTNLSVSDSGGLKGTAWTAGGAVKTVPISMPANGTTLALNNPSGISPVAYKSTSTGEVEVLISNGTGGYITRVDLFTPVGPWWTWAASGHRVMDGSTDVTASWTVTQESDGRVRFESALPSTRQFPDGGSLRFIAVSSDGLYPWPSMSATQVYYVQVSYGGFAGLQADPLDATHSAVASQFTVLLP